MLLLILSLLILIYTFLNYYKSKKEYFTSVCNSKNYVEIYPYDDDQSKWYSEFSDKKFNNTLSNKNFTIIKKSNMKKDITNWINSLKDLKKDKSTFYIVSIDKVKDNDFKVIIHRKGKNHAKVLRLTIIEKPTKYILSNVFVDGYINEFEVSTNIDSNNLQHINEFLEFNNLEDRWQMTESEQLTEFIKPY